MKNWFCTILKYHDSVTNVLNECESLQSYGYKVEQIVYADGQYQIFYSREYEEGE